MLLARNDVSVLVVVLSVVAPDDGEGFTVHFGVIILEVASVTCHKSLTPTGPVIAGVRSPSRNHTYIILTPLIIVKLGFTEVYIIFPISAQKHRLLYSLEPPRRGGPNEYPQSMF